MLHVSAVINPSAGCVEILKEETVRLLRLHLQFLF